MERLQPAGVVTIGKNNVPEFAAGSHTFNEVFGATRAMHFAAHLGDMVQAHPGQVKPEIAWNVQNGWELSAQDWIDVTATRTRRCRDGCGTSSAGTTCSSVRRRRRSRSM